MTGNELIQNSNNIYKSMLGVDKIVENVEWGDFTEQWRERNHMMDDKYMQSLLIKETANWNHNEVHFMSYTY